VPAGDPFASAHSLAQDLNVALATVLARLDNSLRMENFHVRWIPHQLTYAMRATRVQKCIDLLSTLQALKRADFREIVTGEESWFDLQFHNSTQWSKS
jgi:hypothetical protein